ncbi:MAG: hypothetical protein WCE62_04235 [Polyangiales bacterium]
MKGSPDPATPACLGNAFRTARIRFEARHGCARRAWSREHVARGVRELWLTVYNDNAGPIAFYQRVGFAVGEPIVTDIGAGFGMDDYRMMKSVVD